MTSSKGGELFDHILAHRYLKDKDAQRLFAQLVSAVAYLHEKKIVHRDLKLENLLLDRKRNIIVTDFGFANRFQDKESDLMATSCGSPCYAAPELVVQDGRYVGSAVDVWSCGVILYAMLAGYLPFDDDPMNPDSENINLLYKYIINTKLTFPEWITALARDLLNMMLVPDPTKRCGLEDVMQHEWLKDYTRLFNKSVAEVEDMARLEDEERRAASERQKEAVLQQEQAAKAATAMSRSHSSTVANSRHQSAMVMPTSATSAHLAASHLGTPSNPRANAITSISSPTAASSSSTSERRRAHAQSAIIVPSASSKAVFAEPATSNTQATAAGFIFDKQPTTPAHLEPQAPIMQPSASAPSRPETVAEGKAPATQSINKPEELTPKPSQIKETSEAEEQAAAKKRRTAANRYTVQVEYDPLASGTPIRTSTSSRRNSSQIPVHVSNPASPTSRSSAVYDADASSTPTKIPIRSRTASAAATPEPQIPAAPPVKEPAAVSQTPAPTQSVPDSSEDPEATVATPSAAAGKGSVRQSANRSSVPFPHHVRDTSAGSTQAPSARSKASRHSKGASVVSISRFLPGNSTSHQPAPADAKVAGQGDVEVLVSSSASGAPERRKSRRKALSMVVDPFKSSVSSTRSTAAKRASARIAAQSDQSSTTAPSEAGRTRATSTTTSAAAKVKRAPSLASRQQRQPQPTTATTSSSVQGQTSRLPTSPSGLLPDTSSQYSHQGKAKKVMDWFRWKSMPRDSSISETEKPVVAPVTDFDKKIGPKQEAPAPHVVVTPEAQTTTEGQGESDYTRTFLSQILTSASIFLAPSKATDLSRDTSMASARTTATVDSTVAGSRDKAHEPFVDTKLRFHQGAVDQNALTSLSPPVVLLDLRKTLFAMGIDAREEGGSAYRLKCVRQSSKKTAAAYGVSVQALHGQSTGGSSTATATANPSLGFSQGPSGRVVNSTSLAPSPSSTFRALFSRRSSGQSTKASMPSPALSQGSNNEGQNADALMSPLAPSTSSLGHSTSGVPLPFYGQDDPGAEVRFTVEVSRMRGLPNLYAIDIRRLKGNLWSYRSVSCSLGSISFDLDSADHAIPFTDLPRDHLTHSTRMISFGASTCPTSNSPRVYI